MNARRKLYLVSYDVCERSRLALALRIVRDYATGGQKSVHECWLTKAEKKALVKQMQSTLNLKEDRMLIVSLRQDIHVITLGQAISPPSCDVFYFG